MSTEFVLGFVVGGIAVAATIIVVDAVGNWLLERYVVHLSPARRARDEEEGEQ